MKKNLDTLGEYWAHLGRLRAGFCDKDRAEKLAAGIRAALDQHVMTLKELGFRRRAKLEQELTKLVRQAMIRDMNESLGFLRELTLDHDVVFWAIEEWIRPALASGTVIFSELGFASGEEANEELDALRRKVKKAC